MSALLAMLGTGLSSGSGAWPGWLEAVDRLCAQFATALQNAEHDHLFIFAALIGTLALVFPAQS
jgi:hypothetical protein